MWSMSSTSRRTCSTGADCGEDNRDPVRGEYTSLSLPIVQVTKTPESLGTALVRQLAQAEIVEVCREWSMSACRIGVTRARHGTRRRA